MAAQVPAFDHLLNGPGSRRLIESLLSPDEASKLVEPRASKLNTMFDLDANHRMRNNPLKVVVTFRGLFPTGWEALWPKLA